MEPTLEHPVHSFTGHRDTLRTYTDQCVKITGIADVAVVAKTGSKRVAVDGRSWQRTKLTWEELAEHPAVGLICHSTHEHNVVNTAPSTSSTAQEALCRV